MRKNEKNKADKLEEKKHSKQNGAYDDENQNKIEHNKEKKHGKDQD